ncbi:monocarboxylate transporter 6-like [Octopus sinensis]|uniref:Monocarboxylate transporter 6-like n=1 Tax=Octopus sinensis TaxID=2607531 RepID=A0A6P7TJP3_9MOLL|nr:monocarboxylate transporter 6-like [Octopus sinensis]
MVNEKFPENSWSDNPADAEQFSDEGGEDDANENHTSSWSPYEDPYQRPSQVSQKLIPNHSLTTSKISFLASLDDVCEIDKEKQQNIKKGFSLFEGMLLVMMSLNLFMMMGFLGCMGLFYIELLDEFHLTRSIASMVVSVPWGFAFGSGILTGLLINRFPCGLIIVFGSLMMSSGIIASSFASNIISLIVTLGIFSGIGGSFIFISSFIGTGLYFGQRGSYAIAIVSVSVPLGFLLYPLLATVLISEFTWRGAMLILGAISLNSVPFGIIIWRAKLRLKSEETVLDVKASSIDNFGSVLSIHKNDITMKLCKDIFADKKFWVFLLGITLLFSLVTLIFNQLTDFCIELGYKSVASMALTFFNIPSFFGRVSCSLLLRFTRITTPVVFAVTLTLFGLTVSLVSVAYNFQSIIAIITIAGFFQGPATGIYTCVIIEIIGFQRAAMAQGVTDTTYGLATILVGYIAGLISEVTRSYKNGFLLFGILAAASGVILCVYLLVSKCRSGSDQSESTTDTNVKPVHV